MIKRTSRKSIVLLWVPFQLYFILYFRLIDVLVLHPCHKVEYFKKHNWDALWIDTARQIVRDEFNWSYASLDIQGNDADMQVDNYEVVSHFFLLQ